MSTDAITVLKEDHRELGRLFAEFEKKSTTAKRKGDGYVKEIQATKDAVCRGMPWETGLSFQSRVGPGRSHRHGSPSERIAFLAAWATDPAVRAAHDRDHRRIQLGIAALVVLALGATALRLPGGLVRGNAALALERGIDHDARAESARRGGDAAGERAAALRARDAFLEAAALLSDRPDDPDLRALAAVAEWNAADAAMHRLHADAEARTGFQRVLSILEGARGKGQAELRFQAQVELGRLALRGDGPTAALVLAATRHLQEASGIPESVYGGRYRSARLRLLESAIRLRDPDPAVAAQARSDLELQARGGKNDDARWAETNHGRWEGLTYGEVRARFPQESLSRFADALHGRPSGGESLAEVAGRVAEGWAALLRQSPGGRMLVVTHATPIQLVLCAIAGMSPALHWRWRVDLGSVTALDVYGGGPIVRMVNEVPRL